MGEIGVDQIIVDEAQEFRKLSFATNMSSLRGIDPNGSQRAWDLWVKRCFVAVKQPARPLLLSSGTPITNTMGEMFTLQRFMQPEMLRERGLAEFDAWALNLRRNANGTGIAAQRVLQAGHSVQRIRQCAELVAMFRMVADVVQKDDLREFVTLPRGCKPASGS